MKDIKLRESAVVFNTADHTYHLDGRVISGVTPIVKWMFPETYSDIPEDVLARAAEHGKNVHLDCQMADAGFDPASREAEAYLRMKAERGLETLANEWLVDDGQNIASSIDVVFTNYAIADIKATSKIHYDNVTLQLSIYAWLLERMNEGLLVPAAYVIWLPKERYGSPLMTKLERIPADVCERIVGMYLDGDTNEEARALIGKSVAAPVPTGLEVLGDEYCRLDAEAKRIKARMDEIKEHLMKEMAVSGDTSYNWDGCTVSYVAEKESVKIDTAKVKADFPEVWSQCQKTEKTKPYVQIKIRKAK